jgi:hypothetical protein
MIKELIEHKNKYFWSKSERGTIIIGGTNKGRNYGNIELSMDDNIAAMKIVVSNGVSQSERLLPDKEYSKLTVEYKLIKDLFENIDNYLSNSDTKFNQEMHRGTLLQNVFELLPKYDNIR